MRQLHLVATFAVLGTLCSGGVARAHVGAAVATAKFVNPPEPVVSHVDPNDTLDPFSFASANASYTIQWNDGDTDPTGRFTFYYLDHQPTFQVGVDEIGNPALATIIDDPINKSGGYFASCYCEGDQGVTCPTDVRDPAGNCSNQLVWNTQNIPAGTYWIVAVNNDPPFHVVNAGNAPIRVAHGGTPLPAALIVRPDGYGAWDKSYHLQWIAAGKAPLSFDLEYGLEDTGTATTPIGPIASGLAPAANPDGSFSYDWDVSGLDNNKSYWVRLHVTDGDGNKTFTDSHFGVTVFHSGGVVTTPPDMAMAPPKQGGCAVEPMAPAGHGALSALAVLVALGLAFYFARRAGRSR